MSDDQDTADDVVCSCVTHRYASREESPSPDGALAERGEPLSLVVTAAFIDARIPLVAEKLSPANRARFLALPYAKQAKIVVILERLGALA